MAQIQSPRECPAPPYPQADAAHFEKEEEAGKEGLAQATKSIPKRLIPPISIRPPSSENSPCSSLCAASRSSIESMPSVPNSVLPDETAIWLCQQHWQQSACSQRSLPRSNHSANTSIESDQYGHRSGCEEEPEANQYPERISITNSSHKSSVPPLEIRDHKTPVAAEDIESQRHRALIAGRARVSPTRTRVKYLSIFFAFLALIGMVLILSLQQSKIMARAGFTVCTTLAYFCVAAGMWAADRTMVETFIAMNLVVVYGIFLNGQIDVFLDYATNS
jgi:hypothetical protein